MNRMIITAKTNAINRKLTAITKGPRGILDRIQIQTHEWFYSPKYDELYHFDEGVFEAYPSRGDNSFFTHHTLKVLPDDAELVEVAVDDDNLLYITEVLPYPPTIWEDITSQERIEQCLLHRNKRHLEQMEREQGRSTEPLFQDIRENYGLNPLTEDLLNGTFDTTYELNPVTAAFFQHLKRPDTNQSQVAPVLGTINSEQFQTMFQMAKEKTSSDSRTLNYLLWKCIARSDFISSFASILLSLPFTYGFVNVHWTHMSDYMLEKKPGQRQIHTLCIIGKVAAEFNTCLKFFIGKQAMYNFEDSNPVDEQHGF